MTPEELADLRAKAEAATPGPWHSAQDVVNVLTNGAARGGVYTIAVVHSWEHTKENAAFIAAANPATMLRLLDYIAELQLDRQILEIETW